MGKENKKKQVEFNLADYKYMDNNLPLIGWVWEFARRSKEHLEYWSGHVAIQRKVEKQEVDFGKVLDYEEEHGLFPYFRLNYKSPYERWSDDFSDDSSMDTFGVSKSYPLLVSNLKWKLYPMREELKSIEILSKNSPIRKELIALGREKLKALGPKKLKALKIPSKAAPNCIRATYTTTQELKPYKDINVKTDSTNKKTTIEYEYTIDKNPIDKIAKHYGDENVVMALIDLSAPESLENILKDLKAKLLTWRKLLKLNKKKDAKKISENKVTAKSKIWKSYIIIYDIINTQNISFAEVSDILSQYDERYNTEKIVRSHYEKAEEMINGGYKEYIK